MKTLFAPTEDFIKTSSAKLAAAATPGSAVVLTLDNTDGFLVDDYVAIGWEGGDTSELCQITTVTGETITVATLVLGHLSDEPIRKYLYNDRKFYGCVTVNGSFVELTAYGSPVAIQVNDPQGAYLEYTGGEGYLYFKATYFNSTTSQESDITDADAVLGDQSSRYCSIYSIRKQAGLTSNPFYTDGMVEIKRKRAENEVNSYIFARYLLPLTNSLDEAEIPFIVENVTMLLAAGYIDYEQYGPEGQGVKWLGEARAVLKAVQKGTQRLIGSDNNELLLQTKTTGLVSYPNRVDDRDGPARYFKMDQTF